MSPKQTKRTHQPTTDNPKFLTKLSEIINNPQINDIVSWDPEGRAILIINPDQFEQKVLPMYFKHRQITSFVRQLNLYGFHKEKGGVYDHTYANQFFLRDQPELISNIKRKNAIVNNQTYNENIMETPLIEFVDNNEADKSSLAYENSMLFNLQKQAMERLAMLEETVRNLTVENKALWNEVNCQYNDVNGVRIERRGSGERCDASTDSNTHGSRVNRGDFTINKDTFMVNNDHFIVKNEPSEDFWAKYMKEMMTGAGQKAQRKEKSAGKLILNEEMIKESKKKIAQSNEKFDYFIMRNENIKPEIGDDIKEDFGEYELTGAKRGLIAVEDELFDEMGNARKVLKW